MGKRRGKKPNYKFSTSDNIKSDHFRKKEILSSQCSKTSEYFKCCIINRWFQSNYHCPYAFSFLVHVSKQGKTYSLYFLGQNLLQLQGKLFLPIAVVFLHFPSLVQRKENSTPFVSAWKTPTVKTITSQQHDIISSFKVRDGKGSFMSSLNK